MIATTTDQWCRWQMTRTRRDFLAGLLSRQAATSRIVELLHRAVREVS